LDSVLVDIGTLRQKNPQGLMLFEVLAGSVRAEQSSSPQEETGTTLVSGDVQQGAFRDTRKAFEVGNTEQ
jgi:hypothetical protein